MGAGYQLQPAVSHQPDVVDEFWARDRHFHRRFRIQLSGRRPARLASPAVQKTSLSAALRSVLENTTRKNPGPLSQFCFSAKRRIYFPVLYVAARSEDVRAPR